MTTMKIRIDESVEIPEGYSRDAEVRRPKKGERYLSGGNDWLTAFSDYQLCDSTRIVLKKLEPKVWSTYHQKFLTRDEVISHRNGSISFTEGYYRAILENFDKLSTTDYTES